MNFTTIKNDKHKTYTIQRKINKNVIFDDWSLNEKDMKKLSETLKKEGF